MDCDYEICRILDAMIKLNTPEMGIPTYVMRYSSVGGYMDLQEHFGTQAALEFLQESRCDLTFKSLETLNMLINLETSETKTTFRPDDLVVFYPNCPKGVPMKFLHMFHSEEEEECDYLGNLHAKNANWTDVMNSIPESLKSKMFKKISSRTHGTKKDFLSDWLKIERLTPEKTDMTLEQLNLMKGIHFHNSILKHMPFMKGNRRTARLVLSHYFWITGFLPPLFLSRSEYEYQVQFALDTAENTQHGLLLFVIYLFKMTAVAFYSSSQSKIHVSLPEKWEELLIGGKLEESICEYVKSRKRVTFNELIDVYNVYTRAIGDETIEEGESWLARGFNLNFKEAIMSSVHMGKICFTETQREEYLSYESGLRYDKYDSWRPCVLTHPTV